MLFRSWIEQHENDRDMNKGMYLHIHKMVLWGFIDKKCEEYMRHYIYDDNGEKRDWAVALEKHWIERYWEVDVWEEMWEDKWDIDEDEFIIKKWKEFTVDDEWAQFKEESGIISSEEVLSFCVVNFLSIYAKELFEKFVAHCKKNLMDENSKEKDDKSLDVNAFLMKKWKESKEIGRAHV